MLRWLCILASRHRVVHQFDWTMACPVMPRFTPARSKVDLTRSISWSARKADDPETPSLAKLALRRGLSAAFWSLGRTKWSTENTPPILGAPCSTKVDPTQGTCARTVRWDSTSESRLPRSSRSIGGTRAKCEPTRCMLKDPALRPPNSGTGLWQLA